MADHGNDILTALTVRVPLLTFGQIARTWWSESKAGKAATRRCLRQLEEQRLVDRYELRTHPELPIAEPMFRWGPGGPPPNPSSLSYRAGQRWSESEIPTVVYLATKKAARAFGGFPGHLKGAGLGHDVYLGALYVYYLRERPSDASDWVSEYFLETKRGYKEVVPDAALVDSDFRPRHIVEVIGSYPPERIRDLHDDCERRQLPYEFW